MSIDLLLPFNLELDSNETIPPKIWITGFIEEEIAFPVELDSHIGTNFCPMEPKTRDTK